MKQAATATRRIQCNVAEVEATDAMPRAEEPRAPTGDSATRHRAAPMALTSEQAGGRVSLLADRPFAREPAHPRRRYGNGSRHRPGSRRSRAPPETSS